MSKENQNPEGDWSVPKLLGLAAVTLGAAFTIIYMISP